MQMRAVRNFASVVCRVGLRPRFHGTADTGVFEYLLKTEKDGEEFYRSLATKTSNAGFKYIFNMLADEEAKHYRAIETMDVSSDLTLERSTILGETRNVFEQIRADPNAKITSARDHIALYEEARNLEARSRDEYRRRAALATDPKVRALFQLVANEEQKHYVMIDELIKFVGKAEIGQGAHIESAEFA
eukprot:EG_transcript_34476